MNSDMVDITPACDHTPTKVGLLRTERGYRVRCLTCRSFGPEREDSGEAWAALLGRASELVEDRG